MFFLGFGSIKTMGTFWGNSWGKMDHVSKGIIIEPGDFAAKLTVQLVQHLWKSHLGRSGRGGKVAR